MKAKLEQLQQQYRDLPPNDRRALTLLSIFLGGIFLVYGLFMPAKGYFDESRKRAEEKQALLQWIEDQRPTLERVAAARGSNQGEAAGTLLQRVTAAAQRHKITIKRFEPEGDTRIRIWIEQARYQDVQGWMNTLMRQKLSFVTVNLDALAEEGMVSARLTLEG